VRVHARMIEIEATPEEAAAMGAALQSAGFSPVTHRARPMIEATATPSLEAPTPRRKGGRRKKAAEAAPESKPKLSGAATRVLDVLQGMGSAGYLEILDQLEQRGREMRPASLGNTLKGLVTRGLVEKLGGGQWRRLEQ